MKKTILTLLFSFLFIPSFALAGSTNCPAGKVCDDTSGTDSGGIVTIDNPLGDSVSTPQQFIGRIIQGLLGIIGSIALVMFVLGGFTWMTSQGDKGKISKGRDTMLWATLGLVVVFSSYALVRFVIEKVAG